MQRGPYPWDSFCLISIPKSSSSTEDQTPISRHKRRAHSTEAPSKQQSIPTSSGNTTDLYHVMVTNKEALTQGTPFAWLACQKVFLHLGLNSRSQVSEASTLTKRLVSQVQVRASCMEGVLPVSNFPDWQDCFGPKSHSLVSCDFRAKKRLVLQGAPYKQQLLAGTNVTTCTR
jgi:hypothetical protein